MACVSYIIYSGHISGTFRVYEATVQVSQIYEESAEESASSAGAEVCSKVFSAPTENQFTEM